MLFEASVPLAPSRCRDGRTRIGNRPTRLVRPDVERNGIGGALASPRPQLPACPRLVLRSAPLWHHVGIVRPGIRTRGAGHPCRGGRDRSRVLRSVACCSGRPRRESDEAPRRPARGWSAAATVGNSLGWACSRAQFQGGIRSIAARSGVIPRRRAKRAGVSPHGIAKRERPGENSTVVTLEKAAAALGVKPEVRSSAALNAFRAGIASHQRRGPRGQKRRRCTELPIGFEPTTCGLRNRCSTTELG